MWPFYKDLFSRGWDKGLANGSSTGISVVVLGFGLVILTFVCAVAIRWLTGGRSRESLVNALKSWHSSGAALLALLLAWGILFIFSTLEIAYQDHQTLQRANERLSASPPATNSEPKPSQSRPEPPKIDTRISQSGHGNTSNLGAVGGSIKQGDCGVVQNGGSNNTASPNCYPRIRTLTERQRQGISEFSKSLPPTVHVITESVLGSGDANPYANEFIPLFKDRNSGQDMAFIKMGFPVSFTNVWVATPTDDDPAAVYRDALVKKFNELGIPAQAAKGGYAANNLELVIGYRPEEVRSQ